MAATNNLRIAVYPGVFDPVHLGHLDLIERGSRLFDRLIVGVGINPDKAPFFSEEERVALLEEVVAPYPNVEVKPFKGLAVQFVRETGARIMLRGLRTTSDMEYEFNLSMANRALDPEIETVFLMAQEAYSHVSGNLLRQIATFGGPLDKFVPPVVKAALQARVLERQRTGQQPPSGAHRSSAD
ncbi:MAG TPA: pantetheine-phosphate adenylyltransferase [Gemmataceae bacterium]|nr:pantetheine-phosphate adenylyltransferase [Gemmataceae bacterium]